MIIRKSTLLLALVALLSVCGTGNAQSPPPTDNPNVMDYVVPDGQQPAALGIEKSDTVAITAIWKKCPTGVWELVWNLSDAGPYLVSQQETNISEVRRVKDGEGQDQLFEGGCTYRFVIYGTNSVGNSTIIENIEPVTP